MTLFGLAAAFVDDRDELAQHTPARVQRLLSTGQGIYYQQARRPRIVLKERKQRCQPRPDALPPARLISHCLLDDACGVLDLVLERHQQARLAILEQLVERAPRQTRALTDHRDSQRTRTTLKHQIHKRAQQTPTLHLHNMRTLTHNHIYRTNTTPTTTQRGHLNASSPNASQPSSP